MTASIAYLGPPGTYAENAALVCAAWLQQTLGEAALLLRPYPSIAQTIRAVANQQTQLAVVPVENSIEGGVTITLDTLWQVDKLQIQRALVLPIAHALMSHAQTIAAIQTIYSHPQSLAQCQGWLEQFLPSVKLVPTSSNTEALRYLSQEQTCAAIASKRAAQLYNLPILAYPINDYPDNCTRFWVLSLQSSPGGSHTSLAFSLPTNAPGALVKTLQVFAQRGINMSRIESRPSKRALGDYLFFIDLEGNIQTPAVQSALEELQDYTETLKIFGSYDIFLGDNLKPTPAK